MNKQTIKQQFATLAATIEAEQWNTARILIDELVDRKLTKVQRAELASWIEAVEEHSPAYNMGQHIAKYRARYQRSVAASGAKSLNNGDDLATFLEMKTAKEVCELADRFTPIKGGQTHMERYQRLNEGQKRMNSGNKLRAAAKNGLIEVTENGIIAI